jgi:hypothetical protein
MRLLKLAQQLDFKGYSQEVDSIDRELIKLAQTDLSVNVANEVTEPQDNNMNEDSNDNNSSSAMAISSNTADNQIYSQLGKHIVQNNQAHMNILKRLQDLESKLYNVNNQGNQNDN